MICMKKLSICYDVIILSIALGLHYISVGEEINHAPISWKSTKLKSSALGVGVGVGVGGGGALEASCLQQSLIMLIESIYSTECLKIEIGIKKKSWRKVILQL